MTIKLYHASSMPMWLEESIQLIFFYSRSPSIWRCDPLLRSSFDTRSRARCCCEPMRKTLCYLRSSQIYFLVPWIQNMFLYINLYPHLRMHLSFSIFIHISWRSFAPLTDSDPIHIHCFSKISKPEVPLAPYLKAGCLTILSSMATTGRFQDLKRQSLMTRKAALMKGETQGQASRNHRLGKLKWWAKEAW